MKPRKGESTQIAEVILLPVSLTESEAATSILWCRSAGLSLMTTELMLSFSIHTHLGRSRRAQAVAPLARWWSTPAYKWTSKDGCTGNATRTGPGPLLCANFHPSSRYRPYRSSQTCFYTLALSVAPEVTACLPAEWAWGGPPSCPPPRVHHGLIRLLVCHHYL